MDLLIRIHPNYGGILRFAIRHVVICICSLPLALHVYPTSSCSIGVFYFDSLVSPYYHTYCEFSEPNCIASHCVVLCAICV